YTAPPTAPVGVAELCDRLVKDWDAQGRMPQMAWDFRGFAADAIMRALAQQPAASAVALTVCCGREECGGECGNEWRGMEWVRIAQQPAAVDEKYSELIYAVSSKYPGESRHETALRYIRQ